METSARAHPFWAPTLFFAAGLLVGVGFYFLPTADFLKIFGAAAAALLVLYRPLYGLYLLAGTLPFLPNEALLLLGALVAVSFLLYRLRRGQLRLEPVPAEPQLALFLLVVGVYTLVSINPSASLRDFAIYAVAFALFFTLYHGLEEKRHLRTYLLLALLAALVVSFYGLYQYAIGVEVESAWVDEDLHPYLRTRVYSFFGNPNVLAEYLVLTVPFGLALVWSARGLYQKTALLACTAVLLLTLLLTFSRAGWMGMAAALFVFFFLLDRRAFVLLLLGALVVLLAGTALLPDVVVHRLVSIFNPYDTSNLYRLTVWREAFLIIRDFWASGIGLGHQVFTEIYPYYMLTRVKTPFHVHNTYLQLLMELGAVGFVIFLGFLAAVFRRGLQIFRASRDGFLRAVAAAALAAMAGLLVHGLGEHVLYLPKIITLFWLCAALLFLCGRLETRRGAS